MQKTTTDMYEDAKGQVISTTNLNMAPFAEHLVKLVGDIDFSHSDARPVYTRKYLDSPEVKAWLLSMAQFKRNMGRLIAYSGRVVSLARSNLTGPERAQALADYVDLLAPLERGDTKLGQKHTEEDIDKYLMKVREQETLLGALQIAQPMVEEAARFLRDRADEMMANRLKIEMAIEMQIEADYADVLAFAETLDQRQSHNFHMIGLMVKALEEDDANALKQVAAADRQLGRLVAADSDSEWTADDKAVQVITGRLELIAKHKQFIAGDIEKFNNALMELEALTDADAKALQKSKIAVLVWGSVHARLAGGETDPAKYDFMSVAKFAFDLML